MEIGSKTGIFVYARRQANDALVVTIGVDEPHATQQANLAQDRTGAALPSSILW